MTTDEMIALFWTWARLVFGVALAVALAHTAVRCCRTPRWASQRGCCATCIHSKERMAYDEYECRRNAPTGNELLTIHPDKTQPIFPRTTKGCWCGEWRQGTTKED